MHFFTRLRFRYIRLTQYGFYLLMANHIIAVSNFIRHSMPFWLQRKTHIIHNGADHYLPSPYLTRAEARESLRLPEDKILWLYVGRLSHARQPYKGVKELLSLYELAKQKDPRIHLAMAGFGDAEDESYLCEHNVYPFILAPVETLKRLYAAADLYTTCTKWEGFNLPLLEAQTYGVQAVAYRIGAHPEVVIDGDGVRLVADSKGWLEAALEISKDDKKRAMMGIAAKEDAGRFTWKWAVQAYDCMIRQIL